MSQAAVPLDEHEGVVEGAVHVGQVGDGVSAPEEAGEEEGGEGQEESLLPL